MTEVAGAVAGKTAGTRADSIAERLARALTAAAPALLFGLRLATSVCVALYLAFFLQLDNPSWAGTSAAIVAQPVLGASLRKGMFRLIGTGIGAVATVLLTAVFPQNRLGFFLGLAFWCAACSFVSTLLRNFSAYAAMLAGYTMAIIAATSIAAPDQVFTLAVARATEIGLGITCGMVVMSVTDFGHSPRRLAAAIADLIAETAAGFVEQLHGGNTRDLQQERRALLKRAAALDPLVDQTIGEAPGLNGRRTTLRAGISGLFLALAAWRTIGTHLQRLDKAEAEREAQALLAHLPADFGALSTTGPRLKNTPKRQADGLIERAGQWQTVMDGLRDGEVASASMRLGADRTASILEGLDRALNLLVLLSDSRKARPLRAVPEYLMPDIVPPLVNAFRVFAGITAAALIYVVTSWPNGPSFITFVAVTVLLMSPRNEQAAKATISFSIGSLLTAGLAAIANFAVLPNHEGYVSFTLIIFLFMLPVAALSTIPRLAPTLVPATVNFIPLLGPTNLISYNVSGFANSALAIVAGCIGGAVVLRVIGPVAPAIRAQRLLGLTLRDLRGLARHPGRQSPDRWRGRVFSRVIALPPSADPAFGTAQLAALTVGLQLMFLRAAATRLGLDMAPLAELERAIADGDLTALTTATAALERQLTTLPDETIDQTDRQRLLAGNGEIADTVMIYPGYFGAAIR